MQIIDMTSQKRSDKPATKKQINGYGQNRSKCLLGHDPKFQTTSRNLCTWTGNIGGTKPNIKQANKWIWSETKNAMQMATSKQNLQEYKK